MFKVGDRVRIRQWDDMAAEFGDGDLINCRCNFVGAMRRFCGRTAEIFGLNDYEEKTDSWRVELSFDDKSNGAENWSYSTHMIELLEEPQQPKCTEITRFSHSRVELFDTCPFKFKFRYVDEKEALWDYAADNPLKLGSALHKGIETDAKSAIQEYFMEYPVITDAHITESIKLETMINKVKDLLRGEKVIYEYCISTKEFIGFIDLLQLVEVKPDGTKVYDMYDFKYSNNREHYLQSRQLHVYKALFEQTTGHIVRNLGFIFIPKNNSKQRKDESLVQFRQRVQQEVNASEPYIEYVKFDEGKVYEYYELVDKIQRTRTFEKKPSYLCKFCEIKDYCERSLDYMVLPSNERREVGAAKKRKIWIYGAAFSGKTTMLDDAPDPLNLNTDGNIEFVTMPYIAIKDVVTTEGRITKRKYAWEVFKETIEELEKKQNTFKTIIVDLVEDTREMCRIYKYNELGIQHESDSGFGKAYDMVKTEYLSVMRRFFNLDYENLIVISHEDVSKDITKKNGQNITRIAPNIQDALANKIAGMVDIVARVVVEDDGKRTLNFKQNEVIFGGGRLKGISETTIPLSWDALMAVYDDAAGTGAEEKPAGRKRKAVEEAPKEAPKEEPKEEVPVATEEPQEQPTEEAAPTERKRRTRKERE